MSESWPKAVLFDLDGTLIDSVPDIHAAINETLASLGEPPLTIEAISRMVGRGVDVLIERVFEALGKSPDPATRKKIGDRYLAIYSARATELTTLNPGASGAVRGLRARGLRLGVVTNKPAHETALVLDHFGLSESMEVVVGGDAGVPLKPAPDLLLLACKRLGVEPADALFVGDSENDVGAARAAGLKVVVLAGGYTALAPEALGADLVVDRLDEIEKHLPALQDAPAP